MTDRPWHAHYDNGVPADPDIPDLTLPEFFTRTAERYPERIATVFAGKKLRYREIQGYIHAFAAGLRRTGVEPGDRVALMLPNVPQYPIAFFGALEAGAIVVPTNPLYTRHELEHQLADSGACAVVTLDQLFPRLQQALPATEVRMVVVAGIGEALPLRLKPLYAVRSRQQGVHKIASGGIVYRFEDLLAGPASAREPHLTLNDVAVLQYTGGTTGRAKGAMLSHKNLVANATQAYYWQGTDREREAAMLLAVPCFHVYGLSIGMNLSIASGATMLLAPRFIPKEIAHLARKYRPQMFPGVPTMYLALSDLAGFSQEHFGSLRICISGAAPLPSEVQRRFLAVSGARIVEGYGLTEASPVTHCNPVYGDNRPGTVGVPFPGTDAKITDPDTWQELPPGTVGEITVSGPQIMLGYWNRAEETSHVLRNGWLHTGDLGAIDVDGYLTVVDRIKDVIIASGFNVYPREVEDVLYSHPGILEAAVIGVASEYRGETVKAFVVPRDGSALTAEQIIAFCAEQLAPFKVPKLIELRDQLPKTVIGKVLRRELRDDVRHSVELARPLT
jgi:long-chain acyl-CoA synthetase